MTTDVAVPRLRVGLIGCDRVGLHLIERSTIGGPFQIVAACADSCVGDLITPFGVRLMSLQEIAQSKDIDVFWMTSFWEFPFASSPFEAFQGQHLIVEAPFTLSVHDAEQAFADATARRRLLLIHQPRRSDPEFQQALTVARDEKIGAIRAAKFVHWIYGRPPCGVTRGVKLPLGDEYAEPHATKVRFVAHALDQLVVLIPSRPIRVMATTDLGPDLFACDSLVLHIDFESGCQSEIDIRLDSPTPFQSGWILTGERGGFAKGRQFTLTDEGEVFDSPVTPAGNDEEFTRLARQIHSGVRDVEEELRGRSVVSILEAAQRSLVTSQSVTL